MGKVFAFLAVLAATIILIQWFVIVSVRRYLFGRYEPVNRKFAYAALAVLGIGNLGIIQLVLYSPIVGPGSFGQKILAVSFLTYLGCMLFLLLFFLIVGAVSSSLRLGDWVGSMINRKAEGSESGGTTRSTETEAYASARLAPGKPETALPWEEQEGPVEFVVRRTLSETNRAPSHSRRSFLRWSAAAGVITAAALATNGIVRAYRGPVVEEFDVEHPLLEGLDSTVTLIQVTDFHYGMLYGPSDLEKLVTRLNSLEGQALLITGDTFHSHLTPVETAEPILKRLKPRSYGNFAVLGNHDFYTGEVRCVESLERSGLTMIRDEWITFRQGRADIHLGGIDDPMENWVYGDQFPGFPAFMKKNPKSRGMRILLSHRPNAFPLASREGIDMVLAGHIHGGQIILPWPGRKKGLSLARFASLYTHGWYRMGQSRMYLSRGVGLTFVPWRINCPPEIAVFHLKPPTSTSGRAERNNKTAA